MADPGSFSLGPGSDTQDGPALGVPVPASSVPAPTQDGPALGVPVPASSVWIPVPAAAPASGSVLVPVMGLLPLIRTMAPARAPDQQVHAEPPNHMGIFWKTIICILVLGMVGEGFYIFIKQN